MGIKKRPERDRSYHHGDLKAALKNAVLELVKVSGPRGFSLNEASRLAGVSVAAPYRHFPDKEALVAEVICDGNALLERELRDAADKAASISDRMLDVGMAYIRFARTHAEYFTVMFNSGIDKSKYPDMRQSAIRAFSVIQGLAAESERSEAAASERAISLWALTHGLATLSSEGALTHASSVKGDQALLRSILKRAISQKFS